MSAIRLDVHPFLSPAAYLRRPAGHLPFPLDEPECRLYPRARHGLFRALEMMGLEPGDEVLAPAYHHGSEIEALQRAGLRVRFYEGTDALEPDPQELDALMGPRVRALHVIHYLGFPQDCLRWRAWCDERGLLLIEDAAQAWLSSVGGAPVGSFGDIAFFSFYKSVALADGAAMVTRGPSPPANGSEGIGARELARHHRTWLAQRVPRAADFRLARGGPKPYDAMEDFGLGDPRAACARTTRPLLERARAAEALRLRRHNYRALLLELRQYVPRPFSELTEGACPLYLPIEVQNKEALIVRLAHRGVRGLNLWLVPHPSLAVHDFPAAANRRRTTVGLPVHQGLTAAHLGLVAAAVQDTV